MRIMRDEPSTDDGINLYLLCLQIEGNDCWDCLLQGLNERGQNEIIDFIERVLYKIGSPPFDLDS